MFEGLLILEESIDNIEEELFLLIQDGDLDDDDVDMIQEEMSCMKSVLRVMRERLKRL